MPLPALGEPQAGGPRRGEPTASRAPGDPRHSACRDPEAAVELGSWSPSLGAHWVSAVWTEHSRLRDAAENTRWALWARGPASRVRIWCASAAGSPLPAVPTT